MKKFLMSYLLQGIGELLALELELDLLGSTKTVLPFFFFIVFQLGEVPSPDSYRLTSDFEYKTHKSVFRKSHAFTFGTSREAYEKVYSP